MKGIWNEVKEEFLDYGVRESSALAYTRGLKALCKFATEDPKRTVRMLSITEKEVATLANPYDLLKIGIDKIELLTKRFIRRKQTELAPKYLNVIYCSIKRWCMIKQLIKSAKAFQEIKFDKSSRKTDGMTETALETVDIKNGFKVAELDSKVDWGLYGLCGIRPAIIPKIKVKWIHQRSRKIENGKLTLVKPTFLVIPRIDEETKKPLEGNKGNITFFTFISSRLAEYIELRLNSNGIVTPESYISTSRDKRAVDWKIREIYKAIGFEGRPYLLRSYADDITDAITRIFHDEDLKEHIMGHKGKISAVYQFGKSLTKEKEIKYRNMYIKACDKWINEHIFEMRSKDEMDKAEMMIRGAEMGGIVLSETEKENLRKQFGSGKMTFEQFTEQLKTLSRDAFQKELKSQFEKMYLEMQEKHNNNEG